MTPTILAVVGFMLAAALIVTLTRLQGVLAPKIDQTPPSEHQADPAVRNTWQLGIEDELGSLRLAVADGIERVSRAEKRIQKQVTSARRLVREAGLEHAGVEAEYEELHVPDGEGIEPLSPVQPHMDNVRSVRIPGGHLTIGAA